MPTVSQKELARFIEIARQPADFESHKDEFHTLGKRVLKVLAEKLGLTPAEYDIRSNKGGDGVRGEVTLHAQHIYVQFGDPLGGAYLYRGCRSRRDYSGFGNQWGQYLSLGDLDCVAQVWLKVMNETRDACAD